MLAAVGAGHYFLLGNTALAELAPSLVAMAQLVLDDSGASPIWQVAGVASSGAGEGRVTAVRLTVGGVRSGATPVFTGTEFTDDRATAFVDQVYTAVIEESGGTVMRPCPEHPHPSWPKSSGGKVTWVCPSESER